MLIAFAIAVVAVASQSNATRAYEGDPRPPSEVATIKKPNELFLTHVDGNRIAVGRARALVEILPGVRTLRFEKDEGAAGVLGGPRVVAYPVDVSFEAKSGHVYSVKAQFLCGGKRTSPMVPCKKGMTWTPVISDDATKEQVFPKRDVP